MEALQCYAAGSKEVGIVSLTSCLSGISEESMGGYLNCLAGSVHLHQRDSHKVMQQQSELSRSFHFTCTPSLGTHRIHTWVSKQTVGTTTGGWLTVGGEAPRSAVTVDML